MYKYQMDQWVVIEHPSMRPVQAQITGRMKDRDDASWYQLAEKETGNKIVWNWQPDGREPMEIEWYPEKDLSPVTHSPEEDNPNETFKKERLASLSSRRVSYSQFCVIKNLMEETEAEVEGDIAKISFKEAEAVIKKLKNVHKAQEQIQ